MLTEFMARPGSSARARPATRPVHALALMTAIGLTCIATVLMAYVLWPRWPAMTLAGDAPMLPITVAGVAFNVPPGAMRVPVQRRAGAHERVDLAFLWPSLEPPHVAGSSSSQAPAAASSAAQDFDRIFVTISVAADKLAPTLRVKTIYPRYATIDPEFLPSGMAVLAFRTGTPYQGEDLVYDATTPDNFLARCTRTGAGSTPGTCLYERRIEGADLVVRFNREWLEDWQLVASSIDRLITVLHQQPKQSTG
jgi:hypothetical protein